MSEKNNEREFEENMSDPNGSDDLFSEITAQDRSVLGNNSEEDTSEAPKKEKKISIAAFVVSCIALVLAAVMITYTCCSGFYRKKIAEIQVQNAITGISGDSVELLDRLKTLCRIFEGLSITDYDSEIMMNEVLKAYVRSSGDKYAEYYTADEYLELMKSNTGASKE